MFGTNGSLNHLIAGSVVVDGLHLTIKLNADIPKEERDEFAALVKEGSYPLFCAEGQGGWVHGIDFIDGGAITITSSSKLGLSDS
ncbi:hypothetical protein [Bacillus altitudinis]|uniref:hypothetical protein n=1 Tax=Bacillus altitudinis TaxID=293387 RepID=UPI0003A5E0F4